MKFGLTKSVAVQIRKQPDEESLNRLVTNLEDKFAVRYTFSVDDKQFLMHPTGWVIRIDFEGYYSSFWTDVKGKFSETDEQNNLLITCRPTKGFRAFLTFFFGFLIFVEVCLALAVAFDGLKDFWSLLFPVLVGTVGYLISYFATFDCVKKITAAIEKCL